MSAPSAPPIALPKDTRTTASTSLRGDGSSLFVEDPTGDRQNLVYASLDRHVIPRYHTVGNGALIGLNPKYRITSRSETRREIQDMEVDSARRSRAQSLLSNLAQEDSRPIKFASKPNGKEDLHQNFMRLYEHPRKRRRLSMELGSPADSTSVLSSSDNESGHSPVEDAFDAFKKDPIHQRHMELSRATDEQPHEARTWLALIDYQQVSLGDQVSKGLSNTSRNLVDLRISLYEQALSQVSDSEGRHALILGLMQEGNKIWDVRKQASQWQAFLDKDSSFDLWILYLNFTQSNALKFNVEECLEVFKRCLQIAQNSPLERGNEPQAIYILLRATMFLWQSGFTERAFGIWQASLEYNFFRPVCSTSEELLSSFEEFWSSESARIGEDGATGWKSNSITVPETRADDRLSRDGDMDFAAWAAAEADLEKKAAMPARALDDVSEADPYRVLLFSDVKDFLFSILTDKGLITLRDAFLLFSGLPTVSPLEDPHRWRDDPFVYSRFPAVPESSLFRKVDSADFDIIPLFPQSYTAAREIISSSSGVLSSSTTVADGFFDVVRRAVMRLAVASPHGPTDDSMMEYAIALEAGIDMKVARKQAKSFLKRNSDSPRLYNVYALMELHLGNFDSAERVWSTALSMRRSFKPEDKCTFFLLWRDWVYSYMSLKKFPQAKAVLAILPEDQLDFSTIIAGYNLSTNTSIATQIKTERYIKSQLDNSRSRAHWQVLVVLTDILALHKYLNADLRLDLALETYDISLKATTKTSTENAAVIENIHENRARFLHAHSTTFGQPFRPRDHSSILAESVQNFPDNIRLLLLHHYYCQKSGLVDRLRQLEVKARRDVESDKAQAGVIPAIFDIFIELSRPSYSGSTNHSIRASFRRAMEQGSRANHCIGVWKTYVLWEISELIEQKRLDMGSGATPAHERKPWSKMILNAFYASIRACPWSKELYMLAFTQSPLTDAIGNDGLKSLYDSMVERGLRIHIDISDRVLLEAR